VALARSGYGYWSLVAGAVTGVASTTAGLLIASPFRPGLPCRQISVRPLIKYGKNIFVFDAANYLHRHLDNLLLGRFHGPASLGIYTRAYDLLMLPIHAIRSPILMVAFPGLSSLQEEKEALVLCGGGGRENDGLYPHHDPLMDV
jgi:PST family polysaccharide transporter